MPASKRPRKRYRSMGLPRIPVGRELYDLCDMQLLTQFATLHCGRTESDAPLQAIGGIFNLVLADQQLRKLPTDATIAGAARLLERLLETYDANRWYTLTSYDVSCLHVGVNAVRSWIRNGDIRHLYPAMLAVYSATPAAQPQRNQTT